MNRNVESALKTSFCHFPNGTTFVAIPMHRDEKSYILNKSNRFLVALLRGGKMTVRDLFRVTQI